MVLNGSDHGVAAALDTIYNTRLLFAGAPLPEHWQSVGKLTPL